MQHQGERHRLELLVADVTDQPPIIGRDWLSKIKIDWKGVFHIKSRTLQQVLDKHEAVFEKGLGTMKKFNAKLHLKSGATPKFVKARPVPFALRPKVEASLEKLEQEGVLEKVTHCEWGSPIVVVPKKTGGVRICGDYKVTLNQVLDVDQHPLPKPSDLFATLAGGKVFSKLDLTQAYHQMEVDEKFQHLLTITTHKGLCRYHRLPFGISSTPALFQRTMEQILQGIPGAVAFMDDIELTGATAEEHLDRLDQVLQRLEEHGLRLQKSKCEFLKDRVEYLGHIIDKDGLHPVPEKVRAITDAPAPSNVSELRSYLGMLQYYARFLPNLSSELSPLHDLLKDKTPWLWTDKCQAAFLRTKQLLTSARVLTHYDVNLPIRLECDACSAGLGAVISHDNAGWNASTSRVCIHVHVDHLVAAPPCAPLPDTQVTKAHPNSPSRPTSLIPEVRNPAHSPNPDSPDILSPVPVPEGSTTSPVSSPAASRQGRTSDTTLVPNPQPKPAETAGVRRSARIGNHLQNLICECALTHSIRDSASKDNHNS